MTKLKIVLWGLVVALILVCAGWLWGSSGRWDAQAALGDSQLRMRLGDARGNLALARVDLFELNYGQASRHLQQAKDALNDAAGRLDATNQQPTAEAVRAALAKTVEAQQLAASVNTTANERAGEALKALDRAVGLPPAK
jgi:hypothetical protein